jgi:hypothetical protein
MISVRKFWTIVILVIALSFSFLAYAETYLVKGDKVKSKNGTEYLIFKDENKVQLGFKVDGLNLVPIKDSKTDSIKREIKKKEESEQKAKEKAKKENFTKSINRFSYNMLKLCMTIVCILLVFGVVCFLGVCSWVCVFIWVLIKKR